MTDKDIADIYRDMELQLIDSMKRNLGLHIAEEGETQLEYPQWQAIKLKELRKYQKQNKDIIKRSLRGLPADVAKQLRDELKQGHESEISKYRKAIGEEKFRSSVAMNESFFKLNTRKIDGLISEIKQSLRTAEHAALRMSNDVYRDVIAKSALYVSNGVMTPAQAIDMATKDFLNRGLNCIEYKDGRRVNIADYCDMAVKTANQRAYLMGEGEFRKQIGRTLVIISKHNTSCPLCRPFERKVLIDDVYSGGKQSDGDYMLLSVAMRLGLFHPRCRHGAGTYYPELEGLNGYETEDNKLNDYGAHNEAHIDNMIQKYKRFVVGCLDPENVSKYQERLDYWEGQKAELAANDFGKGNLPFNTEAKFEVNIPVYSEEINFKISKTCKELAQKGSIMGNENLRLLDIESGEIIEFKEGDSEGVGGTDYSTYIDEHKNHKFVFMHNHPSGEMLSMQDMNTFFSGNCFDAMIASGHNGNIFIAYGKKKKLTKGMALTETFLYDDILTKDLRLLLKSGKISSSEFARELEARRVNFLLENYCEHIEVII